MSIPETAARPPRSSRYYRPRRPISLAVLVFGLVLGIAGGLYVAWVVAPVEEVDTAPWQLNRQGQADYVAAVMLAYGHDSDLSRAVTRLLELRIAGDPIQYVAELACDLARTGTVAEPGGDRAIRAMMTFYQLQGRTGCADQLMPAAPVPSVTPNLAIAATPTLPPPPTKTPTPDGFSEGPTATPTVRVAPTVAPQQAFVIVRLERFCDADFPALIEVYVQQTGGAPLPGQRVRARWSDGESVFVTGVKPGRGADFADFEMSPDLAYTVDMPGLSDPSEPVVSAGCIDAAGRQTRASYRVVFRPAF
jgi:hypothetical protein